MVWFGELCPAFSAPITIHSVADLTRKVTAWDIFAIEVSQLLQTLLCTPMATDGTRSHSGVGTCVSTTCHPVTACLEKILDSYTFVLQIVFQNS